MEVTCTSLWSSWLKAEPENKFVISAKNKMKSYSKDDWQTMSSEAQLLVDKLADITKNKISVDDQRSFEIMKELHEHLSNWFFVPDQEYYKAFLNAVVIDSNYKKFFDQFYPGANKTIRDIVIKYSKDIVQ